MINIVHMILTIIIEKQANYIIDFLKSSDGFYIKNPEEFQIKWTLKDNRQVVLYIIFTDILFYEFLIYSKKDILIYEKWKRKFKDVLGKEKKIKKWKYDGLRIINENEKEKVALAFCIW